MQVKSEIFQKLSSMIHLKQSRFFFLKSESKSNKKGWLAAKWMHGLLKKTNKFFFLCLKFFYYMYVHKQNKNLTDLLLLPVNTRATS